MSLGDLFGSDDSEAQGYLQQALKDYQNINVPTIAQEQVNNLPMESVQGTINPQQIQAVDQAQSAFNNVSLDPNTIQAQKNALQGFTDIANAGGLDANAKLAIQQATNAANEQSQGAQGAIQQAAQAEGQGGGANALALRAIAAQGASNNAADSGMQAAAMAENNRQNALSQMGNIGSSITGQEANEANTIAGAQNSINAANQGYRNQANVGNVTNNLTGQTTNLQNAQNVNAANTTAGQGQVYYNAGLPQQQFNNEMAKAGGMAGVNQSQAGVAQQAQQNSANATGQLLKGGLTLGATALGGPVGGAVMSNVAGSGLPAYASTSKSQNAQLGYAEGGMVDCYADGGAPHNHYLCMLMGGAVSPRNASEKAEVAGNSKKNDKIPAMLSEGELVIPREVPKDGKHMEAFAKNAPVGGNTSKRVDMTQFTKGYKKGGK